MSQATDSGSRRTNGRVLGGVVAALVLLFGVAIMQPKVANAAHSGGGFHGGASGFHGSGFHHGFRHFRDGFGFGGIYVPYWWDYGYPYYSYGYGSKHSDYRYYGYDPGSSYYGNNPDNGYGSHPNARQTWYYCSDPAGYYPYVAKCNTGWQPVPAS